jgi:hypothetical protein
MREGDELERMMNERVAENVAREIVRLESPLHLSQAEGERLFGPDPRRNKYQEREAQGPIRLAPWKMC